MGWLATLLACWSGGEAPILGQAERDDDHALGLHHFDKNSFRWMSIPLDDRPAHSPGLVSQLLGCLPFIKDEKNLKYGDSKTHWQLHCETALSPFSDQEVDQYARSFLMYLVGTTLFADAELTIHLSFLTNLTDLNTVASFA
ncbi:conserved hypothetical protein [Ricinus communis]|uniref:Uncharacterized protein n=1 Tax=Ricinus communis TaxID=3988 RepID=B9RSN4_RICCO|nr:conserved hypothetical protein [Ricinus communis]